MSDQSIKRLPTPNELKKKYPMTPEMAQTIQQNRSNICKIISKKSDKLLVIVGPCSIHSSEEALEYARQLKPIVKRHAEYLQIVMRVYLEKPRTSIGWKGLISDPYLDNSRKIPDGLMIARELLCKINQIGIACATEFLDLLTIPIYLADLISWGCIGARTSESQPHRQMVASLDQIPIGFKNGTSGSTKIAIDGILAAQESHVFLGVDPIKDGKLEIIQANGNPHCHVVLRGGWDASNPKPNYFQSDIQHVSQLLQYSGLHQSLMIDCSHGNSKKNYLNQPKVATYLAQQIAHGNQNIVAVMLESNLHEGKQSFSPICDSKLNLKPGISITDACLNISQTVKIIKELAGAVKIRRQL